MDEKDTPAGWLPGVEVMTEVAKTDAPVSRIALGPSRALSSRA